MSLLLIIAIAVAAVELIKMIAEAFEWGSQTLPSPNINDHLREKYHPEECDLKMQAKCREMLQEHFPEPKDMPLYIRIQNRLDGMAAEDKKAVVLDIAARAAQIMQVDVDKIEFIDDHNMGSYHFKTRRLSISNAYVESDIDNVELIKTIFHELKHGVQYQAIGAGGNVWGYSDETLIDWLNNLQHYTRPEVDRELYFTQPLEIDSFGFECAIVPRPGLDASASQSATA